MVAFDNYTFGIIRVATNRNVYVSFIKNGVEIIPQVLVKTVLPAQTIHEVSACRFRDLMLVQYEIDSIIRFNTVDLSGNLGIEDTLINTDDPTYSMCQELSNDKLLFTYIIYGTPPVFWVAKYKIYDFPSRTFTTTQTNLADDLTVASYISKIAKLKTQDITVVVFIQRNYVTTQYEIYYQKFNTTTGAKIGSNIILPKDTPGEPHHPYIQPTDDGGFVIMSVTNSDFHQVFVYNREFNLICKRQFSNQGSTRFTLQIYKNLIYSAYVYNSELFGNTISLDTCELIDKTKIQAPTPTHQMATTQYPNLAISQGTESVILGVSVIYQQISDPNIKYFTFYEYFVDQLSNCPQHGCAGCYNGHVCPVCQGTDHFMRIEREVSPGVCTCKSGYIDIFASQKDCQQCDIKCQSCAINKQTCDSCKSPTLRFDQTQNCENKIQNCPLIASVVSIGQQYQGYTTHHRSQFFINSQEITFSQRKGLHMIVLDYKGEILNKYIWASDQDSEVDNLNNFIDSIPSGNTVLLSVSGDVFLNRNAVFYTALQKIGLNPATTIDSDEPFAIIGKKDAIHTDVVQQKETSAIGKVVIEGCVLECNYKCGSCSISGQNTQTESCYQQQRVNQKLNQCTQDACQIYPTLLDAQTACSGMEYCSGVVQDGSNYYTQYDMILQQSVTSENAWLKYQCDITLGNAHTDYTCDTCSHPTRPNPPDCECEIGKFDEGVSQCSDCHYACESCHTSAVNCQTCSDVNRDQSISNCPCKDSYYDDGTPTCKKCHYKCSKCINNSDQCTQCSDINRYMDTCDCIIGYFDNGSPQCLQCKIQCLTCESQSDNCIKCSHGVGRSLQLPSCGCSQGYFEIEGILDCQVCDSNCLACQGSASNCTQCVNNSLLPPYCNQHLKEGNYLQIGDSGNQLIKPCNKRCKLCEESQENCLECSNSLNRLNNPPICSCEDGFHDNNGLLANCIPCPIGCLKCSSDKICIQCDQQKNFIMKDNQCVCEQQHKLNFQTICQQCYQYQNSCFFQCPITTEYNYDGFLCQDLQITIKHNLVLIYLVLALGIIISFILPLYIRQLNKGKYQQQYNTNQTLNNIDTNPKRNKQQQSFSINRIIY